MKPKPKAARPAKKALKKPAKQPAEKAILKKKILIVDDDPGFLELYSALLENAGYAVDQAEHALQRRLGISVLFVTHDQAEAMVLSDRIAVMRSGRIEQVGSPFALYEQPATPFVRDFLGRVLTLEVVQRQGDPSHAEMVGEPPFPR